MQGERAVRMAARMYEMRDTARRLLGDKYKDRMAEYAPIIQRVADNRKCSVLQAGGMMASESGDGMMTVMIVAAMVEMIEPSNSEAGTAPLF